MELYFIIVLFILGTVFGSFFNVVGYRLPRGESISYPPSHCPKCDYRLRIWELIPIFSFIFLKGRCSKCQNKIAPFYTIFEFLTGVLFAGSFWVFGFSYEMALALIIGSTTIVLIISDLHFLILPDEVLIVAVGLSSIVILISENITTLLWGLLNGAIAFGIMFLLKKFGDFLFKKESMGGGDIKLMFLFGLLIGYEMALFAIILAAFMALPIALIFLAIKKLENNLIPFGPFLCIACLIIFFTGYDSEQLLEHMMIFSLFRG